MRLGAYEALLSRLLEEFDEEEARKLVKDWVEMWLDLRKWNERP